MAIDIGRVFERWFAKRAVIVKKTLPSGNVVSRKLLKMDRFKGLKGLHTYGIEYEVLEHPFPSWAGQVFCCSIFSFVNWPDDFTTLAEVKSRIKIRQDELARNVQGAVRYIETDVIIDCSVEDFRQAVLKRKLLNASQFGKAVSSMRKMLKAKKFVHPHVNDVKAFLFSLKLIK